MDGRAGPSGRTYSAFLSYSSPDRAFTERFQRRIETYRFPTHIVRRIGDKRLKRVFRDRSEMVASPDLSQSIRDALDESDCLVVICSPASARSVWVGYEIKYFRETRENPCILAALISGDEKISFPPELLASGDGAWPLAADFRAEGDGDRMAFLKLVAAMGGIGLDDLIRRDTQRRIRRIQVGAAAMVAAAGTTAGVAVVTLQARATAATEQARCGEMVRYYLKEGRDEARSDGNVGVSIALNKLVAGCFKGRSLASMTPEARWNFADVLYEDAANQTTLGDFKLAKAAADLAYYSTRSVLEEQPEDPQAIFAHAQSEHHVAANAWSRRDLTSAWAGFKRYFDFSNRLRAMEPTNPKYRLEVAFATSNLATLTLRETSDVAGARRAFSMAQRQFEAALARAPNDAERRLDVADGESWLADAARLDKNFDAARDHRTRQQAMVRRLLAAYPYDARYKAALLVSLLGMARMTAEQGLHYEASAEYARAYALAAEMAGDNPKSALLAKQKRAIELFQAQNWLSMPARTRPSRDLIAATVGDCEAEWRKQGNTELAAFCTMQAAWLAHAGGHLGEARRIISDPRLQDTVKSGRITANWRLNLQSELQSLLSQT